MSDTSLLFNLLAIDKASEKILGVKGAFGMLAVGVAAGAATLAEKSIKMAGDFESSTNRLITSAGETHQNIDMVRKGMLDMAGQVGDSAQSLSAAMYTVESGGRHGAEGLEVLRAAAEGAKAEGADLTVVADALTSVLQDYHLKGSDAARVTSEMVAAVGAGKTTFEQFAGSLHSVLPLASSANVSFEDISAALASMTVHGMSADQASQNLNDVLNHMVKPTGVMTTELGQLGMSSSQLKDMLGKRGLTGTLQDLSQLILSHMGPSGKVMLNSFNQSKDAAHDANVMIAAMPPNLQKLAKDFEANKVTLGDWKKELKTLPPEQANLLQQFATLQNRASGFSNVLKSGGPAAQNYQEALAKVTGDATGLNVALMLTGENTSYVNDTLKTISGATTEAGNHVKGWADVQSTFNQRLSEFKAHLGALTIQLGNMLLPVAKEILKVTVDTVDWFTKHKGAAQALGIAVGILAGGMLLYKTYLLAANVATKAATIAHGLHTAAVNASKVAIAAWTAVQGIGTSTLGTWIGVQAIDFAAWVRKAATVVGNTAALAAHLVVVGAVRVATLAWTAVQWALNVAMDANPIGLIVIAIALLVAGILYLWFHSSAFRKFWIEIWNDIWGFLKGVGHWFSHDFVDFFVNAYHWIVAKATEAALWLHTKWSETINFFSSIPGKIKAIASTMWNGIGEAFRGVINWVLRLWNGLQFKIPSVTFMGLTTPGFTLGVPQMPYLAAGGDIAKAGVVMVGERGPEPVYLPKGASVAPSSSLKSAMGGGGEKVVRVEAAPGDVVAQALLALLRPVVRGTYGGDVTLALGGRT